LIFHGVVLLPTIRESASAYAKALVS
jgi:hypothetical protein